MLKNKDTSKPTLPLTITKSNLLVNESDKEFREMVHNLLALSARLEIIRSQFGAYIGLTGVQYTILISIRHLQGEQGVGIKSIANHLALSGSFVTIETKKLINSGLAEKRPNPNDFRRVLLTVTKRGRTLLNELAPVQQEINNITFGPLDIENFKAMHDISRTLRESSEKGVTLSNYLVAHKD